MHIIQAFFLWFFVSSLMIGGAFGFRYFFPRESPWFGFIVPPLAFVLLFNFIEHFVALPSLMVLTPVLIGGMVWLIIQPGYAKRDLLLPSVVFVAAFAFTFGIRCLEPDIIYTSDGLADLNKINNYCQGDTLPPIDTWLPPYKYQWYYSLQHYAASLIKRMLNVKIGVAYNVTHALLSALICVAGAAAAHRLSGGRTWITLVVPFMIESAATGSSAYFQLTMHNPSLWLADNPAGAYDDLSSNNPDNPIWKLLAAAHHERLELQVPGFWTWRDEFHANQSGHFIILLAVLVIAELVTVQRVIWPWVVAVLLPFIAVVASTWAYPVTGLVCGGGLVIALVTGQRPALIGQTMLLLFGAMLLLWPALYDVTSSPEVPDIKWTQTEEATPFLLFLFQWWPIIFLWLFVAWIWFFGWLCKRLKQPYGEHASPAAYWVLFVVPIMLIGMEWITVEGRYNTVEKMWGYTYGIGMFTLFPIVASRASVPYRILTIVLLFSAMVSMYGWLDNAKEWLPWGRWPDAEFSLEGTHYIKTDDQKNRMMIVLSRVKHATFLTGKCVAFNYYESPAIQVFTENRSYATWTYFESVANYREEAEYREKENNDFYAGTMTNRLAFLQSHDIEGVMIWPDDAIPDDQLAALTTELGTAYHYVDCKGNGDKNAGVFLR